MELAPAWRMGEDGVMGAASIEFDPAVQGGYGLDRLEIRECDLRYDKDVEDALADVRVACPHEVRSAAANRKRRLAAWQVDAVIYCASAFNAQRQKLPDRVDGAASAIASAGMNLFELRLGKAFFGEPEKADGSDGPRREAAKGKTAE